MLISLICRVNRVYMCRSPNWNLGRSGIGLDQFGILFWSRQIPDLPGPNENSSLAGQIQNQPRPNWNIFSLNTM